MSALSSAAGLALVLCVTVSSPAQEPSFHLGFASDLCGQVIDVPPHRPGLRTSVLCTLATSGNPGEAGASAWSVSIAVEGFAIEDLGTFETDAGPLYPTAAFERSEVALEQDGIVSTVVLSQDASVTLPPGGELTFLRASLLGRVPFEPLGATTTARIFYRDGLHHHELAQPVVNAVQWNGASFVPRLDECSVALLRVPAAPCPDAELGGVQAVFQTRSVIQVSEPYFGLAAIPNGPDDPAEITVPPGRATVYAGLVSDGLPSGIQGWSLGISVSDEVSLVGATFEGTAAAPVSAGGLFDAGLQKVTLVDPSRNAQGQGVVFTTVLSILHPVTLEPDSTATVLALGLEGQAGARGALRWRDGLDGRPRMGESIPNEVIVAGQSRQVSCFQSASVTFDGTVPAPARFVRGEANADGALDLSDGLTITNFLFLGGRAPPCPAAADANDDGGLDVSDAIAIFQSLFFTGIPLPPPRRCEDEQPQLTLAECPPSSTECP